MFEMFALNATEVRKDWGAFIDSVIREKPKIIKRSRDYIFTSSIDMTKELLKPYTFTALSYIEEDGSVTLSLNEFDLVVNAENKDAALDMLARDLQEYSEDFYKEFEYWHSAPNRKPHLPYIMNVLLQNNLEGIKNIIKCQAGES